MVVYYNPRRNDQPTGVWQPLHGWTSHCMLTTPYMNPLASESHGASSITKSIIWPSRNKSNIFHTILMKKHRTTRPCLLPMDQNIYIQLIPNIHSHKMFLNSNHIPNNPLTDWASSKSPSGPPSEDPCNSLRSAGATCDTNMCQSHTLSRAMMRNSFGSGGTPVMLLGLSPYI